MNQLLLLTAGAALCAATVLTACDSTDSHTDSAPTPVFASGSATPGMPGNGSMPDMPGMTSMPGMTMGGDAQAPAPASPNTVFINNFAFGPKQLSVPVGTTVTWTNEDEEPHNVVATDSTFRSPTLGTGESFTFTFTKAGTFDYLCSIHPFMRATVKVTQ